MPKLIAIIDDEQEMGFVYSMVLESWISQKLVEIKFFNDARDFVDWFQTHTPDLVLSDINMPFINGTELAKIVKRAGSSIPIYFISGDLDYEYRPLMKAIGVERFLNKPLNFHILLELIERELGLTPANF